MRSSGEDEQSELVNLLRPDESVPEMSTGDVAPITKTKSTTKDARGKQRAQAKTITKKSLQKRALRATKAEEKAKQALGDVKIDAGKLEHSLQQLLELKDKNGLGVHVTKAALLRIATMPSTFSDAQIKQVVGHDVKSLNTIRRARIRVASCILANTHFNIRQKIIDALPPCLGPLTFQLKQNASGSDDFLKYDLEAAESLVPALDPLTEVSRPYSYQFEILWNNELK